MGVYLVCEDSGRRRERDVSRNGEGAGGGPGRERGGWFRFGAGSRTVSVYCCIVHDGKVVDSDRTASKECLDVATHDLSVSSFALSVCLRCRGLGVFSSAGPGLCLTGEEGSTP